MTQEDKELLLKDICTRLPYGVKVELMPVTRGKCVTLTPVILRDYFISNEVNYIPYLRPMSSMTDEEIKTFLELARSIFITGTLINFPILEDFLNKNHLDYRGLLEKDLALEAPKGMYK